MGNKTKYISITEMARLRGITTETLRHYDRIGLLKPDFLDKHKTRYYSILQYEKLGTIRELQQIGMSLKEIGEYFNSRTLKSSLALLEQQKELVEARLAELCAIRKKITDRMSFLSTISETSYHSEVVVKEFKERYYIAFEGLIHDEIELAYAVMHLEEVIHKKEKYLPIYGTSRYATLIEGKDLTDPLKGSQLICFIPANDSDWGEVKTLPAGKYCCIRKSGDFWEREKSIIQLQQFLEENKLVACNNTIVENVIVDYTVSDSISERLYEFQLLCK